LNFPLPKIQNVAVSFFPGLRCIRNFQEKRRGEAPYPGLFIFHPLWGGVAVYVNVIQAAGYSPCVKLHKVLD
jgi:hypothetical protein